MPPLGEGLASLPSLCPRGRPLAFPCRKRIGKRPVAPVLAEASIGKDVLTIDPGPILRTQQSDDIGDVVRQSQATEWCRFGNAP